MSQSCEDKGRRACLDCTGTLDVHISCLARTSAASAKPNSGALAGRRSEVLAETASGRDIAGRSDCTCQKTMQSWNWLKLQSLKKEKTRWLKIDGLPLHCSSLLRPGLGESKFRLEIVETSHTAGQASGKPLPNHTFTPG